jgi:hypothetical protein
MNDPLTDMLHDDILRLILIDTMNINTLLVCHRWHDVIMTMPEEMVQRTLGEMSHMPSSLYPKLTNLQKVSVQNALARARGQVYLRGYKYRHMITWDDTLTIICDSYTVAPRTLTVARQAYFKHMFDHYEQYRYHVITEYDDWFAADNELREILVDFEVQYTAWMTSSRNVRKVIIDNKMPTGGALNRFRVDLYEHCKDYSEFEITSTIDRNSLPDVLKREIESDYLDHLFGDL